MKESYLITGATGFVGSCIAHQLVKIGKTVHVISRQQKVNWRLRDIEKQINFYSIDLRDKNLSMLLYKINPTYVFHLSAYGSLPKEDQIEDMISTNLFGTINLLQSLNFKKVKLFINTGSSAEYKIADKPFVENDIVQPINDYGVSKVAQTIYCQKEAIKNNLPIITFRLFSPYGYLETGTRLIPHVILYAINNDDIHLTNKKHVRDFIFIKDIINAYLQACTIAVKPGEIFNIGSGKQQSVEEIVKKVLLITNSTSRPIWGGYEKQSRQIEPKMWEADITKAARILKWKPKYSLEKGLNETISWFKENINLYAD